MLLTRPPAPVLRHFVESFWAADDPAPRGGGATRRERVLPTGRMHLVFRLSDDPLRLLDGPEDRGGCLLGHAVVGGARSSFHLRDVSGPTLSVGVMLLPGASEHLFGLPAGDLAGRHTPLDRLWGASTRQARERLLAAGTPERRIDLLESILAARLPKARALHPAVAHALDRFASDPPVGEVVREAGWSHRRFIELFRRTVGLTPKVYLRLLRFQRAIRRAARDRDGSWAGVALESGYSDQAHFSREFREFAGVTPGEYRAFSPERAHHLPLGPAGR